MNTSHTEATYKILIVDGDRTALSIASKILDEEGYQVQTACSGEEALEHIKRFGLPHLIVVEINLPYGMNGFELCEALLSFSDLPIIILTTNQDDETVIYALKHFAEDYIIKPFNPGIVAARVQRVLRRIGDFAYTLNGETIVDEHLKVSFPFQRIRIDGEEQTLTPTETKLLYILMRNAGQIVTNDFIIRRLWPMEMAGEDRLRVYIHRLRKKLGTRPGQSDYIVSQRGLGYTFAFH